MISFEDLSFAESGSTLPQIATLWNNQQEGENKTLYSRVTGDSSTLEAVRELLMKDNNMVLSSFQPSLAVIVTWLRNTSVRLKIITNNCVLDG